MNTYNITLKLKSFFETNRSISKIIFSSNTLYLLILIDFALQHHAKILRDQGMFSIQIKHLRLTENGSLTKTP